jgi:hypothetical protein
LSEQQSGFPHHAHCQKDLSGEGSPFRKKSGGILGVTFSHDHTGGLGVGPGGRGREIEAAFPQTFTAL